MVTGAVANNVDGHRASAVVDRIQAHVRPVPATTVASSHMAQRRRACFDDLLMPLADTANARQPTSGRGRSNTPRHFRAERLHHPPLQATAWKVNASSRQTAGDPHHEAIKSANDPLEI